MQIVLQAKSLLETHYSQLSTRFDPEYGVLWTLVDQDSVPCVTPELLEDLAATSHGDRAMWRQPAL